MDHKGKSLEQITEEYSRQVREMKGKLLDDFFLAYAAQLNILGKDIMLDDICLCEQMMVPSELHNGQLVTKYWYEHKPKFEREED